MKSNVIECPVCGKRYVNDYDICPVCNWENDPIQRDHPSMTGGANIMSLDEAKKAYSSGERVR